MSVTRHIRAALESAIVNVSGFPGTAQRSWENVKFEPTTGTPWARINFVPTESEPAVAGPSPVVLYEGFLTVEYFYPAYEGNQDIDLMIDNTMAAFTVDDVFTSGGVNTRIRSTRRTQGVSDPPWFKADVEISWYSYA